MPARSPQGPLTGRTVIDLTGMLSGPYATQIFGDLGARVIKIESPDGDITRNTPPHYHRGLSAYFLSINRNKESLVLNLKDERHHALLLRLVEQADIVIENFRPGVAARLGVDHASLTKVNPRIVVCSISGFGQDGPYRDMPAYDIIVQAISGGMSLTGEEEGKPVRAGIPIGDLCAGMYAVIAALAGVAQAEATGRGAYFDISMLDCQVAMLCYQASYYLMSGEIPGLQGRGHRSIPTYRAYLCGDGIEIVVAAMTEKMWQDLCRAMGVPELIEDPRFLDRKGRLANRAALDAALEPRFLLRPSAEILAALEAEAVPAAPINSLDRTFSDPQVEAREMVVTLRDDEGGEIRVAGNPIKVAGCSSTEHWFPPRLGADGEQLLVELLGMDPLEARALLAGEPASAAAP